jgi:hypothetical protein
MNTFKKSFTTLNVKILYTIIVDALLLLCILFTFNYYKDVVVEGSVQAENSMNIIKTITNPTQDVNLLQYHTDIVSSYLKTFISYTIIILILWFIVYVVVKYLIWSILLQHKISFRSMLKFTWFNIVWQLINAGIIILYIIAIYAIFMLLTAGLNYLLTMGLHEVAVKIIAFIMTAILVYPTLIFLLSITSINYYHFTKHSKIKSTLKSTMDIIFSKTRTLVIPVLYMSLVLVVISLLTFVLVHLPLQVYVLSVTVLMLFFIAWQRNYLKEVLSK